MDDSQARNAGRSPGAGLAASLALHDRPGMTRSARRLVDEVLGRAGASHLADDAGMVATELVTNALLHGSCPAELVVRVDDEGSARIEVHDSSPGLPLRAYDREDAMTGRGIGLVEALADRWGVQQLPGGKVVWAELRNGASASGDGPDLDAAGWPDLEPTDQSILTDLHDTDPHDTGSHVTVHLGNVPTDLLLAAKAHVDNLVREFTLAAGGARAGTTPQPPAHLAALIDAVVGRFAAARDSIKRQAVAAAHAGQDHVHLELVLPLDAADAGEAYLRALDEVDDYCRAARLLTLESPPQHRVFRRWYVEELIRQLRRDADGGPPTVPETFEERLLQEIDALAEARGRAERGARLYALSSVLASAVTPNAVTGAALQEGVAALHATGGAILLASPSGRLSLPGALGYGRPVVDRLRAQPMDAELPAAVALRTRQPVWLESREERDRRFPTLSGLEPSTVSMCAVPLIVGERCLGALRFSFSEAHLFDDEERSFVQALAAQTAQALDRAQMHVQRVEISERLQRSLLPRRIPEIPGVAIEGDYHSFADGVGVGGDFYDVWACGDAHWALAIGDAAGTGPEAAAMAALVRYTLRALSMSDTDLEGLLQSLNRAFRDAHPDAEDASFCTVLLSHLHVHPGHAVLEVASGGHPGPLVIRADGTIEDLELGGSIVGPFPDMDVHHRAIAMAPGDEVVLYTDGVLNVRRGGEFFGVQGLVQAARRAREQQRTTVAVLREWILGHGRGRVSDDVAVLSLRLLDG
jgi:serine phosphatase RsbU (regulator of sigma subunit)